MVDNDAINITSSQASAEQTRSVVLPVTILCGITGRSIPILLCGSLTNADLETGKHLPGAAPANVLPMRERATAIREMTSDSLDDGEIVIQSVNNGSLDRRRVFSSIRSWLKTAKKST